MDSLENCFKITQKSKRYFGKNNLPKLPQIEGRKNVDELDIFNKLKIGIASDEKIRECSKGEVKKP